VPKYVLQMTIGILNHPLLLPMSVSAAAGISASIYVLMRGPSSSVVRNDSQ